MSEFDSQVVVITGAAGNLGKATARLFARDGARLALLELNEEKIAANLHSFPEQSEVLAVACDLTDVDSTRAAIERVIDRFGRIDVLANIAGGFTMGPTIQDTSDKDWDFMMDLNARSVFHTCRFVIPHMLQAGRGRIINVSARAALEGKGKMGPYCASKAAVLTLTESLAAENKFHDINVNCILPGTVDTPENRAAMPKADHATWVPPEALADVIRFLASAAGRCVTGAAIPVYGQS